MDAQTLKQIREEIGDGAVVGLLSVVIATAVGLSFSYVVIGLASAAVYGFAAVLQRLVPILLGLFNGVNLGVERTLPRLDRREQNAVITTAGTAVTIGGTAISVGFLLTIDTLVSVSALEYRHSAAVTLFIVSVLPLLLMNSIGAVFRSRKQIRLSNISSTVAIPIANVGGGVFGLIFISQDLYGIVVGTTIATVGAAIVSMILLYRYTTFRPRSPLSLPEAVRGFLKYARDASVGRIANLVQNQTPFLLMIVFLDPVDAGLFSMTMLLGRVVRFPLSGINQIFPPIATRLYDDGNLTELNELYKQTTRLLMFAVIPAAAALLLYGNKILVSFTPQYQGSTLLVSVVVFGQLAAVLIGSVGLLCHMTDLQTEVLWLLSCLNVIYVPVSLFLVVEYGLLGLCVSATAMFVSNNVSEMLLLYWKTGLFPFTVSHLKLAVLGSGIFSIVAVSQLSSPAAGLVMFVGGVAVYVSIGYRYGLKSPDRQILREILPY